VGSKLIADLDNPADENPNPQCGSNCNVVIPLMQGNPWSSQLLAVREAETTLYADFGITNTGGGPYALNYRAPVATSTTSPGSVSGVVAPPTTTPSLLPGVPVCDDTGHSIIRPSVIGFGCAGLNTTVQSIVWTSYQPTRATGYGAPGYVHSILLRREVRDLRRGGCPLRSRADCGQACLPDRRRYAPHDRGGRSDFTSTAILGRRHGVGHDFYWGYALGRSSPHGTPS